MSKTLRLNDKTHETLKKLRERRELKSYDDLIQRLLVESGEVEGFGKDPDLPRWKEEKDRASFREE